ncbi:1-phosphofructokinase family hexose kinase [Micromonospora sp. NPDC047670]|uniref:1-phosphofructokinase family hexose kinase n=1 Tax=Micromonospora sp. NPDC047670 TaxID=3364252 RepID=UPI0037128B97
MIVAVCPNPAIDVTYTVPELVPGASHRVITTRSRAGGKGVNVARVLSRLGVETRLLGLAGGTTGESIREQLRDAGIPVDLTAVAGESRRTVTVVSPAGATVLNEPGPVVTAAEWTAFTARFAAAVASAEVVVLSGSCPPGVPVTAYRDLTVAAHAAGAVVLVDAAGATLRHALTARPDLVKPNADEIADLVGAPPRTRAEAVSAAHRLGDLGAAAAVVTRGAAGFVAVIGETAYEARAPETVLGNPTGAGDALAAVLARGLATGQPWSSTLAQAAAVSAAAVVSPCAGDFDAPTADRLLTHVTVEEVTDAARRHR